MDKKNVHVQYNKNDKQWVVSEENSDAELGRFKTQGEAVELANKEARGEVLIHRKSDNSIREKNTKNVKDPRKSKG